MDLIPGETIYISFKPISDAYPIPFFLLFSSVYLKSFCVYFCNSLQTIKI